MRKGRQGAWSAAADAFPLTPAGVALLALCALGFWVLGVQRADLVLLLASTAVAAVVLLTAFTVLLAALATRRRWRTNPAPGQPVLGLETGFSGRTGLRLALPPVPFVEITWEWLRPPGVEVNLARVGPLVAEEACPRRRCLVEGVTRRLQVRDVLGATCISWKEEAPVRVRVLPSRGPLSDAVLLASLIGGDEVADPWGDAQGDRVEMRRYGPGDPARHILWKTYARSRKLMVRIPERALIPRPRACAYLVRGPGDEAGAALARVVLEQGLLGEGWRFGADGSRDPAADLETALDVLARSGNPDGGPCGLAEFLQGAEAQGYQSCLVFVPPSEGPWLAQAQGAARSGRLRLTFVMGIEDPQRRARSRWQRLLLVPEPPPPDPAPVIEVLDPLAPVVLFDRRSGKIYPRARLYLRGRRAV